MIAEPICVCCGYEYPARTVDASGQCQLCQRGTPVSVISHRISKRRYPVGPDGRQGLLSVEGAGFTPDERLFIAVEYFETELKTVDLLTAITIGADGLTFADFVHGLEFLQAPHALDIVTRAHQFTFGVPRPPREGWSYEHVSKQWHLVDRSRYEAFYIEYCAHPDPVLDKLQAFAVEKRLMNASPPYRVITAP